ncbi:hypothetical protein ACFW3C_07215, partial [Streptomyces sp. NPDC058871]|uniref:hypothetical protein n=1 Tax=Streptomyces sp. NPDC058871 TaxID=3346660 RepID=UPI003688A8A3
GLSVPTAVDIAKESADIILLEKDLTVLEQASRSFVQWRAPPGRPAPRPLHMRVGRRRTG